MSFFNITISDPVSKTVGIQFQKWFVNRSNLVQNICFFNMLKSKIKITYFCQQIDINFSKSFESKKKIKTSLDSVPSPSLSVKIQILLGKFPWGVKAKHFWTLSTNFLLSKVWWQHPAIFAFTGKYNSEPNVVFLQAPKFSGS